MQTTTTLQDFQEGSFSATTTTTNPSSTTTKTNSAKRPFSPSSASPSPLPPKSLKKSPTTTTQFFSKLPLPITFPSLTSPTSTLHRSNSEPIPTFNPQNTPFSPFSSTPMDKPSSATFLKPHFQETNNNNFPPSSNALHKLLRSISDPTSFSFGIQNTEMPNSQKLQKMKGIIKGISQLCEEVIYEEENKDCSDNIGEEEQENEDHNKKCSDYVNEDTVGGGNQEAVSVEKKGDCSVIHFNCPCGKVYEILLSGNNCYYLLT